MRPLLLATLALSQGFASSDLPLLTPGTPAARLVPVLYNIVLLLAATLAFLRLRPPLHPPP